MMETVFNVLDTDRRNALRKKTETNDKPNKDATTQLGPSVSLPSGKAMLESQ